MGLRPRKTKDRTQRRIGKTVDSREVLRRLAAAYKLKHVDRPALFAKWPQIVGKRYAAVSQPQAVQGRTLVVRVADSMWGQDLRQHWDEILAKLSAVTGDDSISKLRVVTGEIDSPLILPEPPPPLADVEVETDDIQRRLDQTKLKDQPITREIMARVWANGRRLAKRREEEGR